MCVKTFWGESMIEAKASISIKHSGPCDINDFCKKTIKSNNVFKKNIAGLVELAHISKHCAALLKSLKNKEKHMWNNSGPCWNQTFVVDFS
jgi:hypothetical protein